MIRKCVLATCGLLIAEQMPTYSQISTNTEQPIQYTGSEDHLPTLEFIDANNDLLTVIIDSGISDFRLNVSPDEKRQKERREQVIVDGERSRLVATRIQELNSSALQLFGADGAISPSLLRGTDCFVLDFVQHTLTSWEKSDQDCEGLKPKSFDHTISSATAFALLERSIDEEFVVFFDTGAPVSILPVSELTLDMTIYAGVRIHTFDGIKPGTLAGPITFTLGGVPITLERAIFSSSEIKNGADVIIGMDFMKDRAVIVLDTDNGMQMFYNVKP